MFRIKPFLDLCVLLFIFSSSFVKSQFYVPNATALPYPYQTALGLAPGQGFSVSRSQDLGALPVGGYVSYPAAAPPNTTEALNSYNAMLAQQGIPAYQYPYPGGMNYGQPGLGYPQPGIGYPRAGVVYPQPYYGYPLYGGFGHPYPGMAYPLQGFGRSGYYSQPYFNNGPVANPNANIKTEIIDVSPEYQRKVLGWSSDNTAPTSNGSTSGATAMGTDQISQEKKSRFTIKTDSQTSNFTQIPSNLTKPIITTKKFTTSIRRTFVYDSSKPGEIQPINLHFINGQQVTTMAPPTTTESEEVKVSNFTQKPRRYMDSPKKCPIGQSLAQNGECMPIFVLASLGIIGNVTDISTTVNPTTDENDI